MNLAYLEYMEKRKSKTAAYLLLLLCSLGIFGAHRWYLHEEKAQTMLILGIVSILTFGRWCRRRRAHHSDRVVRQGFLPHRRVGDGL